MSKFFFRGSGYPVGEKFRVAPKKKFVTTACEV
jgi:hypothetical protein